MIGIFLLENFQEALTSEHVNPASSCVVEKVVGTTRNFAGRNFLAILRIEDQQLRRHPAPNEQPVMTFVERHREIILCGGNRPTG